MTPMELNIKRNPYNGGLYCFFEYDGHEFYADLCLTLFDGTECMIFHSKDQQVTNWSELYCKRSIPVTEEALTECVQEFIKAYDEV